MALLIVLTIRNLPSKSTTMKRDDLRQNPSNLASVHLGLNLFALSRTGSLSHTRSPKPANGVPNLRPFSRLNAVSPSAPTIRRQKKAGNTKMWVSAWISRGDWFCGALGRKVRTETSSRKESSEQERTTDKTLLCYLAGHREKGSAHTTMIALVFLVKKYCAR